MKKRDKLLLKMPFLGTVDLTDVTLLHRRISGEGELCPVSWISAARGGCFGC